MDDWWRGAVIYQVYPRSFQDTNRDGVGDLPGITRRLDHIAGLGVDAVWISPFFKSPQADFGYDVASYREVDPLFGSLADFDQLVARAHELGLKVMIDMVLSHTSEQHPWFVESRRSQDNPKADWYVWADWRADGTPPNNWLSIFGGPAWQWEPRRHQYYLHNFLAAQPDLNLHNPAVVEALLGEVAFWLQRGVDGFRLDAIDFAMHDPELRDNPPRAESDPVPRGLQPNTPCSRQRHIYSKNHPLIPTQLLQPLRELADAHDCVLLGELSGEGQLDRVARFTQGEHNLHFAYSFDLLTTELTPGAVRGLIEELEGGIEDGWPCWSFGNHDVTRAVSRLGGARPDPALARLLPVLLTSLRGSFCLYQGEELGLPEAELAFEDLLDPPGIAFWPDYKGRDGCRTPMPWVADRPHGAFSEAKPWLPVPAGHLDLAVDRQEQDSQSTLQTVRRFLRWRRDQPELRLGAIRFLEAPGPILAFERRLGERALLLAFNLNDQPVVWPDAPPATALAEAGLSGRPTDAGLALSGYAGYVGRLD